MLNKIVAYFIKRHLLTNMICVAVFIGGIVSWQGIKKEEMPDVTFDRVRINAVYPGATAEEVEHFLTKEIEKAVKGIDGVYRVTSTASQGNTSITVELEQYYPNKDEAITELRNAVLDVDLPDDVLDKPTVNVFKTTKRAIIDIALFDKKKHLLDTESRRRLQEYAISLENQLLNLPEVNSVEKTGYLQEEIQINVNPEKLKKYKIPLSQVKNEVFANHSRQPAGHIEAKNEPQVTINAQLDTVTKLNNLYIQAGFEGQAVSLADIAEVENAFSREKEIFKVNGHEAVMLRAVKNSSYGILASLDALRAAVGRFKSDYLNNSAIDVVLLDDESIDVRNRLSIIATNGAIGFVLILIMLFLFLNKRSGIWVGMGIPFTICFTLICSKIFGYTINNTTLAAVIIVMGMVVDDAIVIAENIGRCRKNGLSPYEASVQGTTQVFLAVLASVVTTCIAFIPLYFFSSRFARLNSFIPPIIFMMLGASLLESLFILPGHMLIEVPWLKKLINGKRKKENNVNMHWFDKVEDSYGRILVKALSRKHLVFLFFIILLVTSLVLVKQKMRFVMFPSEETREITFSGSAGETADRFQAAELTKKIEDIIEPYIGKEVVGLRTEIARSHHGSAAEENKFSMGVEIVPKEKRKKSADQLISLWKKEIEKISGLEKFLAQKSRWGQSSGSSVEIIVQENDDSLRDKAADKLAGLMRENPALVNVEIERPLRIPEYKIDFQREKIKRLSISAQDISSAFRASLEGTVLYELPKGDEVVEVRLSVRPQDKDDIEKILDIPVENSQDYLVPLRDVIKLEERTTPNSISRRNSKRVTTVYSDINPKADKTPLEIAEYLEQKIFPQVTKEQPSTTLAFTGEIDDTRQSQGDIRNAVILVLLLIFAILAVLFNSFTKPLIIMLAIPFGLVGVVLAFLLHGKLLFGFFASIGCLGLAGVVINDSIVMVTKLDTDIVLSDGGDINEHIAEVAMTRLKAIILTTVTTVAGVLPTAYGLAGYDAMLAEMMLALAWGLSFGTLITLFLVPSLYSLMHDFKLKVKALAGKA